MYLLQQIFPGERIVENHYHKDLNDLRGLELDVWLPDHLLAFEYQGEQHYHYFSFASLTNELSEYVRRDQIKREECSKAGVTLVIVPYWWDQSKASLEEVIKAHLGSGTWHE